MCQQKHYYNTQGRHRIFQVRMRIERAFPKFQLKGFAFQANVLFFDKSRIKGNQMRKHKIPSWMDGRNLVSFVEQCAILLEHTPEPIFKHC